MANTFELISAVTVGSGGAASIDFTSIPSTYTDLCVKVSARLTAAVDFASVSIALNGSTTGFTSRILQGDGVSVVSASLTNFAGGVGGANTTANTFDSLEIYIPNYAGAANKSFSSDAVVESNSGSSRNTLVAGLWSNTAAINQITLTSASGNFAQYSTAYIYGVKNA